MLQTPALAFAEGGGNIINPDGSLLFVFVLFLLLVFVLNRLLFRPIGRVLDERQALTEGATAEARAAMRRYQQRLADYEATIRQTRGEAYRLLEQERAAAVERRRLVIEEAKQQAASEIERAKSQIEQQTRQARTSLEAEARQIAQEVSRTVLGRAVGGAD